MGEESEVLRRLIAAAPSGLSTDGLERRTLELKGKTESTEVVVVGA